MDDYSEKRASERRICTALMSFSYFNQTHCYEAKVLNCSAGGMCFQSSHFLQPGATVCIRVKDFKSPDVLHDCEAGLRCMSLAEVKWCNEVPGAASAIYGIGVKYQPPDY
jgi:PilZ domain